MNETVYQLSEQDMITVFKLRIVNEILCHACDMLDLDDIVGQIENEYIRGYAKAHSLDERQLTLTNIAYMSLKESSYKPIIINQNDLKPQFPN